MHCLTVFGLLLNRVSIFQIGQGEINNCLPFFPHIHPVSMGFTPVHIDFPNA